MIRIFQVVDDCQKDEWKKKLAKRGLWNHGILRGCRTDKNFNII